MQTGLGEKQKRWKVSLSLSTIEPFENVKIYKEMYHHPDAVQQSVSCCISVKAGLIKTRLWDFVNLGVLFPTMGINSC